MLLAILMTANAQTTLGADSVCPSGSDICDEGLSLIQKKAHKLQNPRKEREHKTQTSDDEHKKGADEQMLSTDASLIETKMGTMLITTNPRVSLGKALAALAIFVCVAFFIVGVCAWQRAPDEVLVNIKVAEVKRSASSKNKVLDILCLTTVLSLVCFTCVPSIHDPHLDFWKKLHVAAMTIAFPGFMTLGRWAYHADPYWVADPKKARRAVHATFMALATVLSFIGFVIIAVYGSKPFFAYTKPWYWNDISLCAVHSMVGALVMVSVIAQACTGFFKRAMLEREGVRSMPSHGLLGKLVIAAAYSQVATGIYTYLFVSPLYKAFLSCLIFTCFIFSVVTPAQEPESANAEESTEEIASTEETASTEDRS